MAKILVNIYTGIVVVLFVIAFTLPRIGYPLVETLSDSMYPHMKKGDVVLVNSKDTEAEVGDVILFNAGNVKVMHRVLEISEAGEFETKGDANPDPDPFMTSSEDVEGTVVFNLGLASILYKAVSTNFKFVLIGFGIVLNIVGGLLLKE